jgi:Carboxypeptidase regulatory-like domain
MQSTIRLVAKLSCLALVIALVAGMAFAQTSNGTIAGVVTDTTGAAIANAKVTATSVNTGEVRTTKTNDVGAYRFESVLPGTFSIAISADGFATLNVANVAVAASVVTPANATLKIGQASDSITVEAAAEALQTESAEVSHNISTADISKLPVSNLNAYSLATTLPGVVTVAGAVSMTNGTDFSVNGTRPRGNNFLIEGQDNNDAGIRGQGLQPQNLDAVKEVSVQTNSFAPEFGNAGGSVNNLVFKSGTNSFHGAGWDLLQNSSLNAQDHQDHKTGTPKSIFRENIFGFDLGGPIKKDKLFFFVSHQWDRFNSTQQGGTLIVPTAAGFATLQGLLPTALPEQAAQINRMIAAYGSLRGQSGVAGFSRFLSLGNNRGQVEVGPTTRTLPNNTKSAEFLAKGDYIITPKDTVNLRYLRSANTNPFDIQNFSSQLQGFDTGQAGAAHNAGLTYTRVINNSMINELRASYSRIGFLFDLTPDAKSNAVGLANVSISNMTGWGAPTSVPQGRFHNTYQLQDSISVVKGKHSFKLGFDVADIRVRDTIPFNLFGSQSYVTSSCAAKQGCTPTVSFTGLANYLDDFGGAGATAITFGSPIVRPELWQRAYFFQDAWKLRSNFTLTYGMRWEYSGTPANVLPFPAVDPRNITAASLFTRIEQQPDKNNFGPRLGVTYTPDFWRSVFGENKTVIRAGFGMFYDQMFMNVIDNTAASSPNVSSPTVSSVANGTNTRGIAHWSSVLPGMTAVPPTLQDFFNPIANNLRNPEIYQWNFSVERELPSNFTFTAGYIGTRGAHLFANNEANSVIDPRPTPVTRRIPGTTGPGGRVVLRDNEGDSIYHALNLDLNRKFSKGMEVRAAYTWSKLIDNGSEIFTGSDSFTSYSSFPVVQFPVNRGTFDRGLSAFDRRHRLALTYIYDVPKLNMPSFKENAALGIVSNVINGWELSGTTAFQSGAPGNVLVGTDWNLDGINNDRPFLSNRNAPLTSWGIADPASSTGYCEGTYDWNVTAANSCHEIDPKSVRWITGEFGASNGNFVRNGFTTPWRQDWTFAVSKTFKVTERQSVQFKTEMLNPFNHGNTSVPVLNLISGHPWAGSTLHPCDVEPNHVNAAGVPDCGSASAITFADTNLTSTGARNIRFQLKYQF